MRKRERDEDASQHGRRNKLEIFVRRWRSDIELVPPPPIRQQVIDRVPLPQIVEAHRHCGSPTSGAGTCLGYDERMLLHRMESGTEVERPGRIGVTFEHLSASGLVALCSRAPVTAATTKDLQLVHSREHIEHLEQLGFVIELNGGSMQALQCQDDLYVCAETPAAARISCGVVVNCAKEVIAGRSCNAFALVRPPGHHCSCTRPSGFCFFNNVAVAVRVAQREILKSRSGSEHGDAKPRIMVIDWDVHHCDGTESVFYDDPSVLVFSVHQYGTKRRHNVLRRPTAPPDDEATATASSRGSHITPGGNKSRTRLASSIDASEIDADELLSALNADDTLNIPFAAELQSEGGAAKPTTPEGPTDEAIRSRRQRPPVNYKELALQVTDEEAAVFAQMVTGLESGNSDDVDDDEEEEATNASSDSSTTRRSDADALERGFAGDTVGELPPTTDDDQAPPFYPGTGHADRIGEPGVAEGLNVNFPWPTTGFGDLEYYLVLQEIAAPLIKSFKPEMIFISCGFDCAEKDLLGSMNVTPTGFYFMTKLILSLHDRVVVALEGGYNLTSVALSSEAVLRALLEQSNAAGRLPPSRMLAHRCASQISHVRSLHADHWDKLNASPKGNEKRPLASSHF